MVRGSKHSASTRLKMSVARRKHSGPNKGKTFSETTKSKIRKSTSNALKKLWSTPNYRANVVRSHTGWKHSVSAKRKMRLSAIDNIKRFGGCSSSRIGRIGKNETRLLDEQEQLCGHKILRGVLLEDLGYVVDGYCPDTNTVYEVYEKRHASRVQKDLDRETEICNRLSCDFIIIWDN